MPMRTWTASAAAVAIVFSGCYGEVGRGGGGGSGGGGSDGGGGPGDSSQEQLPPVDGSADAGQNETPDQGTVPGVGGGGAAPDGFRYEPGYGAGSYDASVLPLPEPPAGAQVEQSSKSQLTSFDLPPEDIRALQEGNARFALSMYRQLLADAEGDGNLLFSPYSISTALAMAYAGARGETAEQMAAALRFTLEQERLHPAFNQLAFELASRAAPASGEYGPEGEDKNNGFRLNVVNAVWPAIGFPILPGYLDVLMENYGAAVYRLDYAADPEAARSVINGWVAAQTEERIQELIAKGLIDGGTPLVLTNAVYFKAAWVNHFEESDTYSGTFRLTSGGEVTVPMMSQQFDLPYAENQEWQAVEIPYEREELSMVFILPRATSSLDRLESSLGYEQLFRMLASLSTHDTRIRLPRFSFESSFSLKQTLQALGMVAAFSGAADFSGISYAPGLYIEHVLHKAFIEVAEAGTEAAAATAVIFALIDGGGSHPAAEITLDRPFIFLIRDQPTGAILFIGRVIDPS